MADILRFLMGNYGGNRRTAQQPDPTVKPGVQTQFSVPLLTAEERRQREIARILKANPKYDPTPRDEITEYTSPD